jgi:hypothetical protein
VGQAVVSPWTLSTWVAPVVAYLVWSAHRRARFAAYVFVSVLTVRRLVEHDWLTALVALVLVLLLQTTGARRHCPPLRPARRRT